MQLINTAQELGLALSGVSGVTGVLPIEMKKANGFHNGHTFLLDQLKSECDVVIISSNTDFNIMLDYMFGDETSYFANATLAYTFDAADIAYMEQRLTDANVDYYWSIIYNNDLIDDWFTGINVIELRDEVDDIIAIEEYNLNYLAQAYRYRFRAMLMCRLLFQRQAWYSIDHRYTSWKDGIMRVYEKDFNNKYTDTNVRIIETVNREGTNIPLSTFVHNMAADDPNLIKLDSVYTGIESNIANVTEQQIITQIPLVDPTWTAENIIILREGIIQPTNMYIEFDIRKNETTYPFTKFYKGVL